MKVKGADSDILKISDLSLYLTGHCRDLGWSSVKSNNHTFTTNQKITIISVSINMLYKAHKEECQSVQFERDCNYITGKF